MSFFIDPHSQLNSLEQAQFEREFSMQNLKFHMLDSPTCKRCLTHPVSPFPAKRRKGLLPPVGKFDQQKENGEWEDSYEDSLFFEDEEVFESSRNDGSYNLKRRGTNYDTSSDIATESPNTVIPLVMQGNDSSISKPKATGTLQDILVYGPAGGVNSQALLNASIPEPAVVSSALTDSNQKSSNTETTSWVDSLLDPWGIEEGTSLPEADTLQDILARSIAVSDPTLFTECLPGPPVVSPERVHRSNSVPKDMDSIAMPPPRLQQRKMPSVDSGDFKISKLKTSKEPTLLTLTSYPFRVMYSNEAFSKLSGRKTSVIGESVFDVFSMEGMDASPASLVSFPSLLGQLQDKIALIPTFQDDEPPVRKDQIRCALETYEVTKRNDSSDVAYIAVRFIPEE